MMLLFHRRSSKIAEKVADLHALLEDLPVTADVEEVYCMFVSDDSPVGDVQQLR
jgi:hypothetical protein